MNWRPRLSFTVTIMLLFSLVFTLAVALIIWGYRASGERAALAAGEQLLARTAATATTKAQGLFGPLLAFAAILPDHAPLGRTPGLIPDLDGPARLLMLNPTLQSIAALEPDGRLRRLIRLPEIAAVPGMPPPPAAARFVFVEQAPPPGSGGLATWTFFDAALDPRGTLDAPWSEDGPRATWVRQARNAPGVQVSPVHRLDWAGQPGISISRFTAGGGAVTFDMLLARLSDELARIAPDPATTVFLFLDDGILLAHPDPRVAQPDGAWTSMANAADPLLAAVWRAYSEAQLRPGEAMRLAGPAGPTLVHLARLPDLAALPLLVAVAAPLEAFTGPVRDGLRRGGLWALAGFVVGLVAIGWMARRVAVPLGRLTREADAIRGFRLDGAMPVRSHISEIERLAAAMGAMKASLRTFGAYVPRDLVRQLMAEGGGAALGGQRRPLTVMFTDVAGFTTIAEPMPPEALMRLASAYFEAVTRALQAEGATIDKYIGDAVMAFWNAPRSDPHHALHACRGALAAALTTRRLEIEFAGRGWPPLPTRFGLHSGEAVVGNVGSSDRMAYTAIGTMVNIASRLEGLNKIYGTQILVSGEVRQAAGAACVFRSVDLVAVKGTHAPIEVFELLGLAQAFRAADDPLVAPWPARAWLPDWEAMVAHWRDGRFAEARRALQRCRRDGAGPTDRLAALYAQRLDDDVPEAAAGWSPVIRMETK